MKIWVYLNGIQQGPYSLENARLLPLEPSTPVWYDGLPKWITAAEAPMLADMFSGETPQHVADSFLMSSEPHMAAVHQAAADDIPPRPKTRLVWCIVLTVLCCSPFGIAGLFTGAAATQRYERGDYDGAARMAETTEWMVILGIVFGLIGWPIMCAFYA